jgi:hypothetical protein
MEEKIYEKTNFVGVGNDKKVELLVVRADTVTGHVSISITEKNVVNEFSMDASFVDEMMAALNNVRTKSGKLYGEDIKVQGEAPEGYVEEVGEWDADKQAYTPTFRRINDMVDVNAGAEAE